MNSKTWTRIIALALFAAPAISVQLAAQGKPDHHYMHHHYQLVQIPTLGGPGTNFYDGANNIAVLNKRGSVSGGYADSLVPDPYAPAYWWSNGNIAHAFLWQNGSLTDLGSLPGTNNSASTWISANGIIAGVSENGQIDPSVPDFPEIRAVMWRDGKITNLGTLPQGGYESEANSVNRRGQVVGATTNLVTDANSMVQGNFQLWNLAYPYQSRAFIWDQDNGMQDLGTLGTGTDAEATMINERGQVMGHSYTDSAPGGCGGGYTLTTGSFIWDDKNGMKDIGSLGGTCTFAWNLNNQGQIVGQAARSGGQSGPAFLWDRETGLVPLPALGGNFGAGYAVNEKGVVAGTGYLKGDTLQHATLWRHAGQVTDLGTLGNDPCSVATWVNDETQVVGWSSPSDCVTFDPARSFLWEHGSIVDLNTLIPPNAGLYVKYAYTINNRGEIAVNGIDANGIEQAALLIPCDENHAGVEGCDYSLVDAAAAARENPASVVQGPVTTAPRTKRTGRMPLHRLGPLSGIRGPAPSDSGISTSSTEAPEVSCDQGHGTTKDLLEDGLGSAFFSTAASSQYAQRPGRCGFCTTCSNHIQYCCLMIFPRPCLCYRFHC